MHCQGDNQYQDVHLIHLSGHFSERNPHEQIMRKAAQSKLNCLREISAYLR